MNLLKENRLAKNLTLEDVGNKVGVGKSTVRKWENGLIENMGRDKIVALSKALDISPLDILGMDESESTTLTLITSTSAKLQEHRQKRVLDCAEKQLEKQNRKIVQFPNKKNMPWRGYASAGTGEFLDGETEEVIQLPENEIPYYADFVLTVNGDSMKPLFKDNDLVFVEETTELYNGSIGIVVYAGEAYLKKIYFDEQSMTLVSLNPKYEDIIIPEEESESVKIVGNVLI